jgi:pre-mRNA-splicing factor ISY1
LFDEDGTEVIAVGGYRYFGAAKMLPGVKELYSRYSFKEPTKTRYDLVKSVNTDYYGYRDDDDGQLEKIEKKAEEEEIAKEVERYQDVKKVRERNENVVDVVVDESKDLILDVQVPSKEEIENMILEKRKRDVLQKYIER